MNSKTLLTSIALSLTVYSGSSHEAAANDVYLQRMARDHAHHVTDNTEKNKQKTDWDSVPSDSLTTSEQHIFLHYDYLVAPGPNGHSHEPSKTTIDMIVAAFEKQKITLHIDPQHSAISEDQFNVVTLERNFDPAIAGSKAISIYDLKAKYYPKAKHKFEHYVIFSHFAECDHSSLNCNPYASGRADLPGYNLIVSLGGLIDLGVSPMPAIINAGTWMHELGHNLGLHHGGDDDLVQKPNYLSVMNYSYQFGIGMTKQAGLLNQNDTSTVDPSTSYRIDYSDRILPTLYEGVQSGNNTCVDDGSAGMNEMVGLPAAPTNDVIVFYADFGGESMYAPSGSRTDWNADGQIETTRVFADVSGEGLCKILHGYDDWVNVHQYLANEKNLTPTTNVPTQ